MSALRAPRQLHCHIIDATTLISPRLYDGIQLYLDVLVIVITVYLQYF